MTDVAKTTVGNTASPRGNARGGRQGGGGRGEGRGKGGPRGGRRDDREPREFEQKILELARVTRVTKGGKRMRFRASLVIGDRRGRVGFGVAKGADVAMAVEKAFRQAKKTLITVPLVKETLPHEVQRKFAAAIVLLKPAPQGTGLKCGGPTRVVLELAGVPNAVSKLMGSGNKINNAKATFLALAALRKPDVELVTKA
ncbi:MAG: 30S ribosomal protein S5 [Patescibacteria group bacterium]|jgi:small subunit ribosomal protein S5